MATKQKLVYSKLGLRQFLEDRKNLKNVNRLTPQPKGMLLWPNLCAEAALTGEISQDLRSVCLSNYRAAQGTNCLSDNSQIVIF